MTGNLIDIIRKYGTINNLTAAAVADRDHGVDDMLTVLGGIVFRYVRFRTSGHLSARAIVDGSFARFIRINSISEEKVSSEMLFKIIDQQLALHLSENPGQGLSMRQFEMIKILESLPGKYRIAVELILEFGCPVKPVSDFMELDHHEIGKVFHETRKKLAVFNEDRRGSGYEERRPEGRPYRRFQKGKRIESQPGKYRKHKDSRRRERYS